MPSCLECTVLTMNFDLSGRHGIPTEIPALPQNDEPPPSPKEFPAERTVVLKSALKQSWAGPNEELNGSNELSDVDGPSMFNSRSDVGHFATGKSGQTCTHSFVQTRVMMFQKERAEEKARALANVGRLAIACGCFGLPCYMIGSGLFSLDILLPSYMLRTIGLILMGITLLLLSVCPLEDGFDADSAFDSHTKIRRSAGLLWTLYFAYYARYAPHLMLFGIVPSIMMLLAPISGKKTCFPANTTLLTIICLSLDLGNAGINCWCAYLSLGEDLSDYCTSRTNGNIAFILQACWSTGGLFYSVIYYALRLRSNLTTDDRTVIAFYMLHVVFFIQGVSRLISGVSKLAAGNILSGCGVSCIAVAWLVPATIISAIGSRKCFKIASRIFEDRQANKDSAFMAMLLDDVTITVGQDWWVHLGYGSESWKCGEVVKITDTDFTVRVAGQAATWRSDESGQSSLRSGGRLASKFSRVSSIVGIKLSFGSSSRASMQYVEHVFPLAGRQLSTVELLNIANANLRCIDWTSMSYSLFDETSLNGKVEGNYDLSRPLKTNERIDFFLSHSWHDDPVLKWTRLEQIADNFFQETKRYPTFWLDKVCIDQSNLADGLKVLPIYVMMCRKVLALIGETYPQRLWCVWELFTVFAFAQEEHALKKVVLNPIGNSEGDMFKSLCEFDSSAAFCFDPNEERRLRRIIESVGKEQFESSIRQLSHMCFESAQHRKRTETDKPITSAATLATHNF